MAAWSDKVTTCEQTGQRLTLQLFRRALRTSPGVPAQADPAGLRLFGELNWDNICAANPGIPAPAAVKVLRVMWQAFPAANRHKYQIKAWTPAGKQQLQWIDGSLWKREPWFSPARKASWNDDCGRPAFSELFGIPSWIWIPPAHIFAVFGNCCFPLFSWKSLTRSILEVSPRYE
jgi:hypothetical protein